MSSSASVEVVVPWKGGCSHRERAWKWCCAQYPYPVWIGHGGEPWIKALAVMPVIETSNAEIIVMADADVFCEGLEEAVQAVADGAPWARPHNCVRRLSEKGTEAYIAGEPWQHLALDRDTYGGIDGGGILVARRETFLEIPMDPRFVGWGNEDWAHGFAFFTLYGEVWKGNKPLIHLWHPPMPRDVDQKNGSQENRVLWDRYRLAREDPNLLRVLLQEARDSLADHAHSLHDHSAQGLANRDG
jgi:hypothetical protein